MKKFNKKIINENNEPVNKKINFKWKYIGIIIVIYSIDQSIN